MRSPILHSTEFEGGVAVGSLSSGKVPSHSACAPGSVGSWGRGKLAAWWAGIGAFVVANIGFSILVDLVRPLWRDEILTLYMAREPDFESYWHAMMTGPQAADPPLYAWLVHALLPLLGSDSIALRLPSSIGAVSACLALYAFAARRCSPMSASIAMLYPMTTVAIQFTSNGRSYGLWLGFTALAMVCWQRIHSPQRSLALAGLALALAGGLLSHYYSVFVTFAFGVAELFRIWERRKFDAAVWVAMAVSAVPLAFCWPLIVVARSYPKDSWARPLWSQVFGIYAELGGEIGTAVLVFLLVWLSAVVLLGRERRSEEGVAADSERTSPPPSSEVILAAALTALPIIGLVAAKLVTQNMNFRYALPAVCGIATLMSLLVDAVTSGRPRPKVVLALALSCMVAFNWLFWYRTLSKELPGADLPLVLRSRPDLTIPLVRPGRPETMDENFYFPTEDCYYIPLSTSENMRLSIRMSSAFSHANIIGPTELKDLRKFYVVPETTTEGKRLMKLLADSAARFSSPVLMENGETLYLVEIHPSAEQKRPFPL